MSDEIQTVSRVTALLRELANADEPLRLVDLVEASGIHKATAHRFLKALLHEGLVRRLDSRRYTLGPESWMIGTAAHRQFNLAAMVQSELLAIANSTQDVALLMVRTGRTAVCMAREEGNYPIRPSSLQVGHRRPLGIGAGCLAILAALDDPEVEAILDHSDGAFDPYPAYSKSKVKAMVVTARHYGYAFVDGLIVPEMRAIAAPILDSNNTAMASITCSAINSRLQGKRLHQACELVCSAASRLSKEFSCRKGDAPTQSRPQFSSPAGDGPTIHTTQNTLLAVTTE